MTVRTWLAFCKNRTVLDDKKDQRLAMVGLVAAEILGGGIVVEAQ